MKKFINKFKIPTLLGLGIIFLGLVSGLYLILGEQTFLTKATPNFTPKNITLTNLSEDSVVISWQTNSAVSSFITYGQNSPEEKTALDDRDNNPYLNHYVTIKNLLSKTRYQYKINSGKIVSGVENFETAAPLTSQTKLTPIIGSVLDGVKPLEDGIVYLILPEATTQSALIKTGGNFLIPLSLVRKPDLSDAYSFTEETTAKLTIRSAKGDTNVLFKLTANPLPLPPIRLGEDLDLTAPEATPQASPTVKDLDKYDLNTDGKINSADNAIILDNFGKKPKNEQSSSANKQSEEDFKKADLNKDGVVDQKDLGLMSQKLKDLGSQ